MKGRKIPQVITEEELVQLMQVEPKLKYRYAYALGFYECLRVSEVVHLGKEHIDKQMRILHIKEAKGHKDRDIPIAPEVWKGLKFIPIGCSIRTLQRNFKQAGIKALNKNLHFHILRHSGITHYLNKKKWDIRQLQRLAGHSKISTTEIYAHVNPEDLVNKMWETSTKATN